uniref:UPF0696 protein C11orf68 homolog n=1 Tax=Crassostrea virginica TaxID=6565 RepID=A0A8B8DP12_CRAVI|nr:UPF0696 protein C11orf68 homolog [Crassostrea virginica]
MATGEEALEFDIIRAGLIRALKANLLNEHVSISVIYNAGRNKNSIEEWLDKNKPSTLHREDGYDWIHVRRSDEEEEKEEDDTEEESDDSNDDDDSDDDSDADELQETWEKWIASGQHVSREKIFELAKEYECTHGKWMLFVSTGGKGDYLWSLIAKGIVNGRTLSTHAKISATEETEYCESSRHVICMYNKNFLDRDQMLESERTIRSLGIKGTLLYKPDIYTHLGVYTNNPWLLNPVIYTSNFDILKNQSIIEETTDFHKGY